MELGYNITLSARTEPFRTKRIRTHPVVDSLLRNLDGDMPLEKMSTVTSVQDPSTYSGRVLPATPAVTRLCCEWNRVAVRRFNPVS